MTTLTDAANKAADNLAAFPGAARPTLRQADLQSLLLHMNGWMTVAGRNLDIKSEHVGAGIYKVWLEERP